MSNERRSPSVSSVIIAGCVAVSSLSAVYIAHGVFSRLDAVVGVIREAPKLLTSIEGATDKLKASTDELKEQVLAARAALPKVGEEIGAAGARASEAFHGKIDAAKASEMSSQVKDYIGGLKRRTNEGYPAVVDRE